MIKIKADETTIVGNWILCDGNVILDANSLRIEELINNYLMLIAISIDGWSILYMNPEDNNYWEQTFMHGDFHGAGPKKLQRVSLEDVECNYNI